MAVALVGEIVHFLADNVARFADSFVKHAGVFKHWGMDFARAKTLEHHTGSFQNKTPGWGIAGKAIFGAFDRLILHACIITAFFGCVTMPQKKPLKSLKLEIFNGGFEIRFEIRVA